ncbi:class I SAM-dependent methyltransferase [Patescibacteria group bacterium]|nr:class I SAM-dependent methyltransferase [Patescibacteria group bacterium]
MNNKSIDWENYFENTKSYPPAPLLVKAMEYVKVKNKAIDIGGGGTLKDTKYLLSQGFETTIIDKEKAVEDSVQNIKSNELKFFRTDFADFDFPQNEYDVAAAIYSLPFIHSSKFTGVFEGIKKSLVKNGIFCGQFFGNRDEWHLNKNLTFVTKEEAQLMLGDMNVILFDVKEFEGKTADGNPKHWHVFDIIARKISN